MMSQSFRLNKKVDEKRSEKSPVVDLELLSYEVVNQTTFRYRFGDFE